MQTTFGQQRRNCWQSFHFIQHNGSARMSLCRWCGQQKPCRKMEARRVVQHTPCLSISVSCQTAEMPTQFP